MAAHDLRNPLAAIKMQAQRMERRSGQGVALSPLDLATVFRQISACADYAFELIDELLSGESGSISKRSAPNPSPVAKHRSSGPTAR
jgi:hypothetical protein